MPVVLSSVPVWLNQCRCCCVVVVGAVSEIGAVGEIGAAVVEGFGRPQSSEVLVAAPELSSDRVASSGVQQPYQKPERKGQGNGSSKQSHCEKQEGIERKNTTIDDDTYSP
jgi:hypothetical protein